jgi:adenylate cyclase
MVSPDGYSRRVDYSRADAAERAGVPLEQVTRLVELGILKPGDGDRFTAGDVRRAEMVQSLERAGISLEGFAAAMERGTLTLEFLDAPVYDRFSLLSDVTFQQLSDRTGVPISLLTLIREITGSAVPGPDDHVREEEIAVADFVAAQVEAGFRPIAIERLLRVQGESLRRMAETEADWWQSEVIVPAIAAGKNPQEISATDFSDKLSQLAERSILATYHAQQVHAWTGNIINGFEQLMAQAGLHSRLERPPAVCFLDITGYTRMTQERGDEAAADLATSLARVVERNSVRHGGRPIKWLGDGVMFVLPEVGPGVVAALEMADGVVGAGLPPSHVGLHAGPVIFQGGDYYGATVNVASRIAEYARPGEVLVSQAVVDASRIPEVTFTEIGPVELKGVSGAMQLHAAHQATA